MIYIYIHIYESIHMCMYTGIDLSGHNADKTMLMLQESIISDSDNGKVYFMLHCVAVRCSQESIIATSKIENVLKNYINN